MCNLTETDLRHLTRCAELAEAAFAAGEEPFGSVLVSAGGDVLFEDHNRTSGGDGTRHPEFEIARWAGAHVAPADRAGCTVYTSGEHCAMCSAAHAWNGLGRIVYAVSTAQLVGWRTDWGTALGPVVPLSIRQVAPGVEIGGPAPELEQRMYELHRRQAERTR
ncbi:nucleoside deaminase [Nakamurella sp. YIM 132087]|uniref:Nucleoside deaminase n=1 Tax=Nakamurella alba TaxID=2665158 RepID=A0A7K1FGS2_9ACTN|nr:nucleoside deaminase [Nakamurella alba]